MPSLKLYVNVYINIAMCVSVKSLSGHEGMKFECAIYVITTISHSEIMKKMLLETAHHSQTTFHEHMIFMVEEIVEKFVNLSWNSNAS